jgi:hypothetical protein
MRGQRRRNARPRAATTATSTFTTTYGSSGGGSEDRVGHRALRRRCDRCAAREKARVVRDRRRRRGLRRAAAGSAASLRLRGRGPGGGSGVGDVPRLAVRRIRRVGGAVRLIRDAGPRRRRGRAGRIRVGGRGREGKGRGGRGGRGCGRRGDDGAGLEAQRRVVAQRAGVRGRERAAPPRGRGGVRGERAVQPAENVRGRRQGLLLFLVMSMMRLLL